MLIIFLYISFEIFLLIIKHFLYSSKKLSLECDESTASIISFLIFLSYNKFLNLSLKKNKTSFVTNLFEKFTF